MKGIRFRKDRQKWQCYWNENGICKYKNGFNTKEEAIAFRQKMVEEHYNKEFYTEG